MKTNWALVTKIFFVMFLHIDQDNPFVRVNLLVKNIEFHYEPNELPLFSIHENKNVPHNTYGRIPCSSDSIVKDLKTEGRWFGPRQYSFRGRIKV